MVSRAIASNRRSGRRGAGARRIGRSYRARPVLGSTIEVPVLDQHPPHVEKSSSVLVLCRSRRPQLRLKVSHSSLRIDRRAAAAGQP